MNEIKLYTHDDSGILDMPALEQAIHENRELLKAVWQGEAEYAQSLGWLEVDKWAGEAWLDRYEELAKEVRANADVMVVVGIGGSNQAARALIDCIGEKGGTKIIWAGNTISPHAMNQVLESLEGKRVYINVIAKNFETLEPGIAFRALRSWLRDRYGESYSSHVICTATEGSHFHHLCKLHGYACLPFPEDIGGRFTALSPIGLFPLAVAGLNIRDMAKGAKDMRQRLGELEDIQNPAMQLACGRNQLHAKGYKMEMLSFFEPRLFRFSRWWMQLFGESEGKNDKGLFPAVGNYSEDLHSIGQFVQEGSPILYELFLDIQQQDSSLRLGCADIDDRFQYLDGRDFHDINKAAFQATLAAHSQRFPCFVLSVPALDEYSFGQLFYFFEFTCYLSGRILGVNPFDQPGVEAYKIQMFQILGK